MCKKYGFEIFSMVCQGTQHKWTAFEFFVLQKHSQCSAAAHLQIQLPSIFFCLKSDGSKKYVIIFADHICCSHISETTNWMVSTIKAVMLNLLSHNQVVQTDKNTKNHFHDCAWLDSLFFLQYMDDIDWGPIGKYWCIYCKL